MLDIKHTEVAFLGRSIKASKNAYSFGKIDTTWESLDFIAECNFLKVNESESIKKEIESYSKSVRRLYSHTEAKQCHDHCLACVQVSADLKYPRYISPEFQRYHWFEIVSSQSTMHLLPKVMSQDNYAEFFNENTDDVAIENLRDLVVLYNGLRKQNEELHDEQISKQIEYLFHKIKSNLPEGYEMWLTFNTNYLQLRTMLAQRTGHRLNDWKPFIEWVHRLPLFDYLTERS